MSKLDKSCKSCGVLSFEITESNRQKLDALERYNDVIDMINTGGVDSDDPDAQEHLTVDGLLNALIDEITDTKINMLVKKHSFCSSRDFIDIMRASVSAKDALGSIQNAEKQYYKSQYAHVLAQIPVEDKQLDLFNNKGDK